MKAFSFTKFYLCCEKGKQQNHLEAIFVQTARVVLLACVFVWLINWFQRCKLQTVGPAAQPALQPGPGWETQSNIHGIFS